MEIKNKTKTTLYRLKRTTERNNLAAAQIMYSNLSYKHTVK